MNPTQNRHSLLCSITQYPVTISLLSAFSKFVSIFCHLSFFPFCLPPPPTASPSSPPVSRKPITGTSLPVNERAIDIPKQSTLRKQSTDNPPSARLSVLSCPIKCQCASAASETAAAPPLLISCFLLCGFTYAFTFSLVTLFHLRA